jgi:hypothetical protein
MKTTVDIDLKLDATEEAKICLTCDKKRCCPDKCKRLKNYYKSRGEVVTVEVE